jgi:hypothetical protein
VKFSLRQILASTAGAVIAAVVASIFGVKGTIVGVAIGSAAATMGTAFVAQSIERGHEAVRQVAVRAPETSTLLRRLGGTDVSGASASSVDASGAPTEVVGTTARTPVAPESGDTAETTEMAAAPAAETTEMAATPAAETERIEISATTGAPATEVLRASARPVPAGFSRARGFSWRAIAASAAIVFVLALLFITAVELISGKPLTAIFGGADTGSTLKNLVNPPPAPTTTPTSTTSTTGVSSTTTTGAGATSTTSTTAPAGAATSTTTSAPSPSTTTTAPGAGTSDTTTTAASPGP